MGFETSYILNKSLDVRLSGKSTVNVGAMQKNPKTKLMFSEVPRTNTNTLLLAQSYDGNLYGIDSGSIFKSTDGMATKINGFNTASFTAEHGLPVAMSVFPDGSISMATNTGKMLHFLDMNSAPTVVLTARPFSGISVNSYSDGVNNFILAGEYAQTAIAKDLYFSKDGGLTFTSIKKTDEFGAANNHWHCAIYDPYDAMIWAAQGDGANARIYYSKDFGATWGYIHGYQPTLIHALPTKVVFGEDLNTLDAGIYAWERKTPIAAPLEPDFTFQEEMNAANFYPSNSLVLNQNVSEYYVLFFNHIGATYPVYIYATGDGGASWHLVYAGFKRFTLLTGVDNTGHIFVKDYTSSKLFRAKSIVWE